MPDLVLQAISLSALVLALHVRGHLRDTGRWPRTWPQWREIAASIVVVLALFMLVSGGRGCDGPPPGADYSD